MSPRWGSTPRLNDWPNVSRNVTLTLTLPRAINTWQYVVAVPFNFYTCHRGHHHLNESLNWMFYWISMIHPTKTKWGNFAWCHSQGNYYLHICVTYMRICNRTDSFISNLKMIFHLLWLIVSMRQGVKHYGQVVSLSIYLSIIVSVAPTWSIGHPWPLHVTSVS
jgi:hypothetical protein